MVHSSTLSHFLFSGLHCVLTSVWHILAKIIDCECQQSYFAMVDLLCLLSNPLLSNYCTLSLIIIYFLINSLF